jgi:hypothetical protein
MDLTPVPDGELRQVLQLGLDGVTLLPGEARKLAVAYATMASQQHFKNCLVLAALCVVVAQAVVIAALL